MDEPTYIPAGSEFDDDYGRPNRMPKWRLPNSSIEKLLFDASRRQLYRPDERGLRSQILMIEKQALSLDTGKEAVYPMEWIEHCASVWKKANKYKTVRTLPMLIKYIMNHDRKARWLIVWYKQHPEVAKKRDYTDALDYEQDDTDYSEGL